MQKLAIDDVSFHTLRHTFATRCVEVGALSIKVCKFFKKLDN